MTCVMYLAALGSTGLAHMARLNRDKAAYLKNGLLRLGFTPLFSGQTFNEFSMAAPEGFEARRQRLLKEKGICFGLKLNDCGRGESGYLFCATETRSRAEIDAILEEVSRD